MAKAMPVRAGLEGPERGIGDQIVGRNVLPGHAALARLDHVGDERVEEPALSLALGLFPEFLTERPDFLADFDAKPDRVVPKHLARLALHHLRADIERGEQGIERRGRGVDQKGLVEAAMFDAPRLSLDVAVLDVDLRGLGKARELLVGRLGGDDPRRVGAEVLEAHGEAPGEQGMELHEAGPGLVEQNVIAKRADLREDGLGAVDRAVIGTLLDHRDAEGPVLLPGGLVGHQRIVADFPADLFLVQRLDVDRPDQAEGVAVGFEIDRDAAAEHQRAMVGGLVVVAVEQHQIARRHQRRQHDLVGGRGAVEHEIGALGPEDFRRFLLRAQGRPLVGQQVAQLQHRIVEVVAKNRLAEMFDENPADRAAGIEHAAIVAGAGPELIAFFRVIDQFAEERRLHRLGILLEPADEVLGDEFRGFLGEEDIAVDIVEHVDRQVLEALAAHQQNDRHFQAAAADIGDQPRRLAVHALLAPVDDHAADGGVGLDRQFSVLDPAGAHQLEAGFLDRGDDLAQAFALEFVGVEGRGAEQEGEAAEIIHGGPATRSDSRADLTRGRDFFDEIFRLAKPARALERKLVGRSARSQALR